MTYKNRELPALVEAAGELCRLTLPYRTALKACRIAEVIGQAAREYINSEKKLNEKYLLRQSDGGCEGSSGARVFDAGRRGEFEEKARLCREKEIDLPLPVITGSELENTSLTPEALSKISPLIK